MFSIRKSSKGSKWFSSDSSFNELYPLEMKMLARRHWTPMDVSRAAAGFLVTGENVSILDIGSGVGKFCLNAAYFKPEAHYYGVEQRKNLVECAEGVRSTLGFTNVTFIHGNFTQLSFIDFDHFYFYNAFFENMVDTERIDDSIDYSAELYHYYTRYLCRQLEQCRTGTRLATFHSMEEEIPHDFYNTGSAVGDLLKFWVKI
ncbi:MAG: methyltransferase domain-containing protein [Agriterribacter sp.]